MSDTKTATSKSVFEEIYHTNFWGSAESKSGPGSELISAENIMRELPILLQELGVQTMLDLPCGDYNWMNHTQIGDVNYTGADVVDDIVRLNNEKYGSKQRAFLKIDILNDQLPKVDLILTRDCLFHFSIDDVFTALNAIVESRSTWLLTTTYSYRGYPRNSNITTCGWTAINLEMAPYFLPPPRRTIIEAAPNLSLRYSGPDGPVVKPQSDRCLGLWLVADIKAALRGR